MKLPYHTVFFAAWLIKEVAAVPVWGQCGGIGYTGPTNCDSGTHCVKLNDWYSQCQPGDDPNPPSTTTTSTTSTTSSSTTGPGPTPTGGTVITLPLGDSITYGVGTNDSNSYRLYLKNLLTAAGWDIDYIGTVKSGTMADNDNEGHSGATISQISGYVDPDFASNPKVVILHAGTNDMIGNAGAAPSQLMQLVDKIVTRLPDSVLLVSTIIPLSFAQSQVDTFNRAIVPMLQQRVDAGNKIVIVSMSSVTSGDLSDGVHPNNNGYQKMANAWFDGWQSAASQGWI